MSGHTCRTWCKNGTTCKPSLFFGFLCICPPEFTGMRCESEKKYLVLLLMSTFLLSSICGTLNSDNHILFYCLKAIILCISCLILYISSKIILIHYSLTVSKHLQN